MNHASILPWYTNLIQYHYMASLESEELVLEESGDNYLRFYNLNTQGIEINFIDENPENPHNSEITKKHLKIYTRPF